MNFEEISKELARLVELHNQHTKTLVGFYEKSLATQVSAYVAAAEKEMNEAKARMTELEKVIKNAGGTT